MKTSPTTTTTTELRRQIATLDARRAVITTELAAIYAESVKQGASARAPVLLDEDEKAARSHALSLLSGIDTAKFSLPPEISRERELFRERRGIDLALKILTDKLDEATEAATVRWWKTAEPKWRELVRQAVLAKVRLHALDRRAEAMFEGIDLLAVPRMQMGHFIGTVSPTPLHEITAAALEAGVVSRAEIKEAEND
jgi:hypothetical protein